MNMRFDKTDKFFSLTTLLIFSLVIHLSIVLLVSFIAPEKKKELPAFITRLVTPNELEGIRPANPKGHLNGIAGQTDTFKPSSQAMKPVARGKMAVPQPSRSAAPPISQQGSSVMPPIQGVGQFSEPGQLPFSGDSIAGSPGSTGMSSKVQKGGGTSLMGSLVHGGESEIIGKAAGKGMPEADNVIKLDTKDFRYGPYMGRVKDRIESVWKYPADAAARGIYGDLEITFTINKNGRLSDIEVTRTSGRRSLDEAAVQALKDGEPYWPIPDEWGKDSITIPGHFTYTIYGTGIR